MQIKVGVEDAEGCICSDGRRPGPELRNLEFSTERSSGDRRAGASAQAAAEAGAGHRTWFRAGLKEGGSSFEGALAGVTDRLWSRAGGSRGKTDLGTRNPTEWTLSKHTQNTRTNEAPCRSRRGVQVLIRFPSCSRSGPQQHPRAALHSVSTWRKRMEAHVHGELLGRSDLGEAFASLPVYPALTGHTVGAQ